MFFYVNLAKVRPYLSRMHIALMRMRDPARTAPWHLRHHPHIPPARVLQRMLAEHGEIELSALGLAISTMVSVAEILKKDGLVVQTSALRARCAAPGSSSSSSYRCAPIQHKKMP
jgi:Alba